MVADFLIAFDMTSRDKTNSHNTKSFRHSASGQDDSARDLRNVDVSVGDKLLAFLFTAG